MKQLKSASANVRTSRSLALGAVLGATLGLGSSSCEEESACASAVSQSECESLQVEGETAECIWVARSVHEEDGCSLVEENEECIQVTGTQAGCAQCGDDVSIYRRDAGFVHVLEYLTWECGRRPSGDWAYCQGSNVCGCSCE